MNILMVGDDTKGSWQVRGVQLGGAIGARATVVPTASDWAWADLVVLVKRAAIRWKAEARRLTVPVVWDVLDFWAQPEDNGLGRDEMIAKVKAIQQACRATTLIGATRAMAADIDGVYLPHHCRIGLQPLPNREKASVVGYEGQRKYLGRWALALQRSCSELGLQFVVNPPDIREADVLVSFRDGRWAGLVCQEWKSGIKLVNAIASGRSVVTQPSAACRELKPVAGVIDASDRLTEALAMMTSRDARADAYEYGRLQAHAHQLPSVARKYTDILQQAAMVTA